MHIAPEVFLQQRLKKEPYIDYYSGDISWGKADHSIDMTNILFKDKTFDYVISNHVLEHIPNESLAVSEVLRILNDTGKWIFSFPICTDFTTYENEEIIDKEGRLAAFGQEDHVRLYGIDYRQRFEKYGLKLSIYTPKDLLTEELIKLHGFIENDVILIAEKA